MPIPFDDLALEHQTPTAAWLRLVEEADGTGIRAALFETSAQGEPQAFYLTRLDWSDQSLRQREDAGQDALTPIVETLLRARTPVARAHSRSGRRSAAAAVRWGRARQPALLPG